MALVDVLSAIGTDSRAIRDGGGTARALQHLRRGVKVLVEGGKFDFQIATSHGKRQVDFDFGLTSCQLQLLSLEPNVGPVLELNGGVDGSVVVENVDGAHQFRLFDIGNAQSKAVDDVAPVAPNQLKDVGRRLGRVVNFPSREF